MLGTQAFGAGMQIGGAFYGARAQRDQLRLQAELGEINARMAEQSARSALHAGERQEQASRLRTAQTKSAQRASLAARGVDLGSGSAAEVLTSTDVVGEWDANTIAANALRAAWGYRMDGVNQRIDANMRRASASAISPGMAAFGTALSQAGQVAKSWYYLQQNSPGPQLPDDDWDQQWGGWTGGH